MSAGPSNGFDLIEPRSARAECSQLHKGKPLAMLHTGLWIKTMYAFGKWVLPPSPPPPPPSNRAATLGLSLTSIVSITIKSWGGGGNTPALIMSSATGAHINTQHRNTTTNLSHTQHTPGEWMLLLISGLMCETSHKYRSPAYKRCFVFFRISRAVIVLQHPGKWLALYLDKQVNAAMKQTDAPNHTNLQLHLRRSRLLDFL